VPAPHGEGGICDPSALARLVTAARAAGRRIGSVITTLPDNPTGQLAQPATVRALCEVAARHDLVIISDEIYRDLVYDAAPPFLSPAAYAPERTVVTTALGKSLALGGWRAWAARLPDGPAGRALPPSTSTRLPRLARRTGRAARRDHRPGSRPPPAGPLREGVLPASAFGEDTHAMRLRVATGRLYGDTDARRELALASPDPLTLPWIGAALDRIEAILADLAPGHHTAQPV